MMPTMLTLVFDGQCGLCTRLAGWLRRLDRQGRIHLVPYQCPGALEPLGLSYRQASSSIWAFRQGPGGTGLRSAGAGAANVALDTALGTRIFTRIYRFPGIRRAQDRVYLWVAEHRHQLPGTTPWCQTHPEDCSQAQQSPQE